MISVISDTQLHNHAAWSRVLPSGRNSRLQDGIDCLFQATSGLTSGDTCVLLGDVFESRKHLEIDVIAAFSEWVDATVKSGIRIILVCGNHDQWLNSGEIHSLRPWKELPGVTIVDSYKRIIIDSMTCDFYAYHDDYDALKDKIRQATPPDYLFLHQSCFGASMDNGESCLVGLGSEDLTGKVATFLGHFHNPQSLAGGKAHYIGSPYQINRGESGQCKRYVVITGRTWSSVPTSAPKFYTLPYDEYLEKRNGTDFFTVVCESESQFVKEPNVRFTVPVVKKEADDSAPPTATTMEAAIASWCSRTGNSGLNEKALRRYRDTKNLKP